MILVLLQILVLLPTAWSSVPEFSHPVPHVVSSCMTFGRGCSMCYHYNGPTIRRESNLTCLGADFNFQNTPDRFTQSVGFPDAPNASPSSSSSASNWGNLSPEAIKGLATVIGYLSQPSPYEAVSQNMAAEIERYQTALAADIRTLADNHQLRKSNWQSSKEQLQSELSSMNESLARIQESASAAQSRSRDALAQHQRSSSSVMNPSAAFLERALTHPRSIQELSASIPPDQLTPEAASLGDTLHRLLRERFPKGSSPENARLSQERSRLEKTKSSPQKTLAHESLNLADHFANLRGSAAREVSSALRDEARLLRQQAEGKLQTRRDSAPLANWLLGRSGVARPTLDLQHKATQALVTNTLSTLEKAGVAAHLDSSATNYLREQTVSSQRLADSAVALAKGAGGGSGRIVETMMDMAYGSVKSIHDFTTGLAGGIYDGFYSATEVGKAIFTQSGTWDRIVSGVMRDLTEDPVRFVQHAVEPLVDFARILKTGTSAEIGHASGELFAQILIGATIGQPLARLPSSPFKAALTSASESISGSGIGRALGTSLDSLSRALPGTSRLARGILTTQTELAAYARQHPALNALPEHLRPKRILVGTTGRNEKVAIIGRPMAEVVNETKTILGEYGMRVERFKPDQDVLKAFDDYAKQFTNGWVPYEAIPKTELYQLNLSWIRGLKNEGYTIIDLGNPFNSPTASAFYDMEMEIVFGKGIQ